VVCHVVRKREGATSIVAAREAAAAVPVAVEIVGPSSRCSEEVEAEREEAQEQELSDHPDFVELMSNLDFVWVPVVVVGTAWV
jgi:hypothetical protein